MCAIWVNYEFGLYGSMLPEISVWPMQSQADCHKSVCLFVTSLFTCSDLLIIGQCMSVFCLRPCANSWACPPYKSQGIIASGSNACTRTVCPVLCAVNLRCEATGLK